MKSKGELSWELAKCFTGGQPVLTLQLYLNESWDQLLLEAQNPC